MFRRNTTAKSVRQSVNLGREWPSVKLYIDLTLSDNASDGDFIQAKKAIHPFLYQVSVYYIKFLYIKFLLHQVAITTEIISQDSYMYVVLQSQADSFALPEAGSFAL